MRLLTPAELREIEQVKKDIQGIYFIEDSHSLVFGPNNKELWLNILDMALQQQESMRDAWRKDKAPNFTDEVANKLRPNG